MKRMYMMLLMLLCAAVFCVPAYAVEPTATPAPTPAYSDEDVLGVGDSISGAMGDYGSELPGVMDDVKGQVDDTTGDMSQVTGFFGYTIGAIVQALPASFAVFLVLFCVLLAVVSIVRVLTE